MLNNFIDESDIKSIERKIDIERALEKLTEIERQILFLSLYGYSQQEIGKKLAYSRRNIGNILENIAKKCLSDK